MATAAEPSHVAPIKSSPPELDSKTAQPSTRVPATPHLPPSNPTSLPLPLPPPYMHQLATLIANYDAGVQHHGFHFAAETQLIDDLCNTLCVCLLERHHGDLEATRRKFLEIVGTTGSLGAIVRAAREWRGGAGAGAGEDGDAAEMGADAAGGGPRQRGRRRRRKPDVMCRDPGEGFMESAGGGVMRVTEAYAEQWICLVADPVWGNELGFA
ncbi:hypothetical protein LTR53_009332 [Teratosphaeriaceae sp. CCFEE 6253]|nr:hypothetical protein LTR53_009332 [Teratosphaeriaceae sp. CCFEE 6253]